MADQDAAVDAIARRGDVKWTADPRVPSAIQPNQERRNVKCKALLHSGMFPGRVKNDGF
jgi:hypothetical protein